MGWNRCFALVAVIALVFSWYPLPVGSAAPAHTWVVATALDGVGGTLRSAILWANTHGGPATIEFYINDCPAGVCTISLNSALPPITSTHSVTITGYTQPDAELAEGLSPAELKIVIDGNGYDCFTIHSANHVITGLVIQDCENGVTISGSAATGNVIAGNHIGTDVSGNAVVGNRRHGVYIRSGASDNTVGGDEPAERNVISGNQYYGVWIEWETSGYNTVSGNYIGVNSGASLDLGNGYSGVHITDGSHNTIGGDTAGERNVISGNDHYGVYIRGASASLNVVSGNIIGGAYDQADDVPNSLDGVRIAEGAHDNTIGGDATDERNVIVGNTGDGVSILGSATYSNVVSGNLIGVNVGDWTTLGNTNGVHIFSGAHDNTIGGNRYTGEANVISANDQDGVRIEGAATYGNLVVGNYIGTGQTGNSDVGNSRDGVAITNGAHENTVGGDTAAERNIISGNDSSGVAIYGAGVTSNTVSGNYIGITADWPGSTALANGTYGVFLGQGACDNLIGGDVVAEGNVISGNALDGVRIAGDANQDNVVSGNRIGQAASISSNVPNGGDGVRILDGAHLNRIGGAASGQRNIISGNGLSGVSIYGIRTMTNTVIGNYIGTDAGGTLKRGNALYGVYIGNVAQDNRIGGSSAGERNLISGNGQDGVRIEHGATDDNVVSGNYIGTNASGTAALANSWNGVRITAGARGNTIGGNAPGMGNLISGHLGTDWAGVRIDGMGTMNNVVIGNRIGTDASGTASLYQERGVYICDGAMYNLVGGSASGERNVISGNFTGVELDGAETSYNRVRGSYIGLTASGSAALPNTYVGVYIHSGANRNIIGGTAAGEGNVISGNANHGVGIFYSGANTNTVAGNYIGTDASGLLPVPNGWEGVMIYDGPDGTIVGPGNVIAFNGHNGVYVTGSGSDRNQITRNSIYGNGLLAIELESSANDNVAAPTITSVTLNPLVIAGTACSNCTVELFANAAPDGEGQRYLGSATAGAGGAFTFVVGSQWMRYPTATATNLALNTSECSAVFATAMRALPLVLRE